MRTGDRIARRTFASHRTTAHFFADFAKHLNNYAAPFADGTDAAQRPYPEHVSLPSPSSPPSAETSWRRKERRRQRSRFLPAMAKTSVRHARLTPIMGKPFPPVIPNEAQPIEESSNSPSLAGGSLVWLTPSSG